MNEAESKSSNELYAPHKDVRALIDCADGVCSRRFPFFGVTLAAEEGVDRLVFRLSEGRPKLRGFTTGGSSPFLIQVPLLSNESLFGKTTARAFLWQSDDAPLVHVLGFKDEAKYLVRALRFYLGSELASVYLQTNDFRRTFNDLVRHQSLTSIQVSDYTALLLGEDGRNVETRRGWMADSKDYAEFFEKLEEENQWVRSLALSVSRGKRATGRIKRDISFSCEDGLSLFFGTVVSGLRTSANANRRMFVDRDVTRSPTKASRPLQITYKSALFEEKRQNRRLIKVLRRLPDSALSVFHPNPYLHASLIDYTDGSSFSIWVNENSSISIIPELKASTGSLERLCSHISEYFGEGLVQEVPA